MSPDAVHWPRIGYCTNVHAGTAWADVRDNLEKYACRVQQALDPERLLGVGLWLAETTARGLLDSDNLAAMADWLQQHRLAVFTLNGFPYGNFHETVVKHAVYAPNWCDRRRVDHTRRLATILARLLPEGLDGSISTLPLGWSMALPVDTHGQLCADHLLEVVAHLSRLEAYTDRRIHLDLEPEPGCTLQRSADVLDFCARFLPTENDTPAWRRHLGVCHDICHAAVMFEDQAAVIQHYRKAGITVGKVQVSSAVEVDFDALDGPLRREAWDALATLCEDRYLHQCTRRVAPAAAVDFHEDLGPAMKAWGPADDAAGVWRVHFHVPIFAERVGPLSTTRPDIDRCLAVLAPDDTAFELETYAWGVLPPAMRGEDLATDLAHELTWFHDRRAQVAAART